ncbi:MAG: hypothetical protein ACJAX4_002891 [Clostridium sp.]|jgi:hypothetical protein
MFVINYFLNITAVSILSQIIHDSFVLIKYIITPILCMEDGIFHAAQCTDFALNKTASSSNFIPRILEE